MALRNTAAFAISAATVAAVTCLDNEGANVDWWVIMKLNNGLRYSYLDARTTDATDFVLREPDTLDDPLSALGRTLTQLIESRGSTVRAVWNDAPPDAPEAADATTGHTNGVIGANASSGFWLTHSTPGFPSLSVPYSWDYAPTPTYGQSFLCISLTREGVELAAEGVRYKDVWPYDSAVPTGELSALYPNVVALLAGASLAGSFHANITSADGVTFTHFSKSGSWGLDIYEDLAQPALVADMHVETWLRSPTMETYCRADGHQFDSINVRELAMREANGTVVAYRETQDHSKWAVSVTGGDAPGSGWACIGDNNRMTSQWKRGGGLVCTHNAVLWGALSGLITSVSEAGRAYPTRKSADACAVELLLVLPNRVLATILRRLIHAHRPRHRIICCGLARSRGHALSPPTMDMKG